MKLLSILILLSSLTSCAYSKYPQFRDPGKELTHTERLEKCIFRLVEKDGVKAEKASKICTGIFRRN